MSTEEQTQAPAEAQKEESILGGIFEEKQTPSEQQPNPENAEEPKGLLADIALQTDEQGSEQESQNTVPEAYELPEAFKGSTIDDDEYKSFTEFAKENKFSQTVFSELLTKHYEMISKSSSAPYEAWRNLQAQWIKEYTDNPEFGGENSGKTLADVKRAFSAGVPDKERQEFANALEITGASNNPQIIAAFARLGRLLGEGTPVSGNPVAAKVDPKEAILRHRYPDQYANTAS